MSGRNLETLKVQFEASPVHVQQALWDDYVALMGYDLEHTHCYHEVFLAMRDGELLEDNWSDRCILASDPSENAFWDGIDGEAYEANQISWYEEKLAA